MNIKQRFKSYSESFFWLTASYLLSPLFYFLIFFKKRKKGNGLNILVIQTAKIGDLVCTTPIFRAIKENYPDSSLTLLATSKTRGIIETNSFLDEIIIIDESIFRGLMGRLKLISKIRQKKFDWSINVLPGIFLNTIAFWALIPNRIQTTSKYLGEMVKFLAIFSNYRLEYPRHTLSTAHYLNLLKFFSIDKINDYKREVFIEEVAFRQAEKFLKEHGFSENDLLIGLCLTAGNKVKEWPLDYFVQLAKILLDKLRAKIIFIGGPSDKAMINAVREKIGSPTVDGSGYFNLKELPALLQKLKLLISVDTGPLYIASACGTPVVDIAGPIDIHEQPPLGEKCLIIQKTFPCVPCSFMIPPTRWCKVGDQRCLKQLSAEEVFLEVKNFLNRLYGYQFN